MTTIAPALTSLNLSPTHPTNLTSPLNPAIMITNTSSTHAPTLTRAEQEEMEYYVSTIQSIKDSYIWIIMAFGFPGNLLTLLVICPMRSLGSPALYVGTLAVVDNLAILVKFLLMQFSQYKVSIGLVGCKIMFFLGNHLVVYANWVLIAMAVERFFAVWQPLRVARTWTSQKAAIGLAVLLVVTLTLTCPVFLIVTTRRGGTGQECVGDPQYEHLKKVWQWGQVTAYGFLPCTLLFTLNIAIIVLIGRARRLQQSMTSPSLKLHHTNSKTQTRNSHKHPSGANSSGTKTPVSQTKSSNKKNGHSNNRHGTQSGGVQRQATILLLVTSTVLVLTTTPICVYLLVQQWWSPPVGSVEYTKKLLVAFVLRVVADSNHAVNFYLYFISARKFRAYFCKALCWLCVRQLDRRGSDVITRHFSTSRSTLRVKDKAQGQAMPLQKKEARDAEGEVVDDNCVPLKLYTEEEQHSNTNATSPCSSLL